jgi:hypothetical protein
MDIGASILADRRQHFGEACGEATPEPAVDQEHGEALLPRRETRERSPGPYGPVRSGAARRARGDHAAAHIEGEGSRTEHRGEIAQVEATTGG